MRFRSFASFLFAALTVQNVGAHPAGDGHRARHHNLAIRNNSPPEAASGTGCFPSDNFTMPDTVPASLDNWWCPAYEEYGFVGFSYSIAGCQSTKQLTADFRDIKKRFRGRYVRMYGTCDEKGYYNKVVDAAWDSGIGVFALIWFGFDGTDDYKWRRDALFDILHSNPKAKFVTRGLQFGSEPLFDHALGPQELIKEIKAARANLKPLGIDVTSSDFAYSFNQLHLNTGGPEVLASLDFIAPHILPFFSHKASTGENAWPLVKADLDYFVKNGERNGKKRKIWFMQNGWPTISSTGVRANSALAVANVQNAQGYYDMLDAHCEDFKAVPGGGVGWFAHFYSETMGPGYGIVDANGKKKFPFAPRTTC